MHNIIDQTKQRLSIGLCMISGVSGVAGSNPPGYVPFAHPSRLSELFAGVEKSARKFPNLCKSAL
jgi:hypothetical protein